MQGQVFQISDCSTASGFTGVSNCFSYGGIDPNPDSFTLNCVGLTPGGIYTVMLDGFAGSTCQFEIAVDNTNPPTQPFISNIYGRQRYALYLLLPIVLIICLLSL